MGSRWLELGGRKLIIVESDNATIIDVINCGVLAKHICNFFNRIMKWIELKFLHPYRDGNMCANCIAKACLCLLVFIMENPPVDFSQE